MEMLAYKKKKKEEKKAFQIYLNIAAKGYIEPMSIQGFEMAEAFEKRRW